MQLQVKKNNLEIFTFAPPGNIFVQIPIITSQA